MAAQYLDGNGNPRLVLLNPNSVNADGTQASLTLPSYLNGAFALRVLGAAAEPVLQIVPLLAAVTPNNQNDLTLRGEGFVEGRHHLHLPRRRGLRHQHGDQPDRRGLLLQPRQRRRPAHRSAHLRHRLADGHHRWRHQRPRPLGLLNPAQGLLYDVAVEPSGVLWIATNTQLRRLDPATGVTTATYNLAGLLGGNSTNTGLQIVPTPANGVTIRLGGTAVPAGSLLLTNGSANPDALYALNPANGTILAALNLPAPNANINPVAGVFTPAGRLFVLDENTEQVVELDPASGTILRSFATPFPINYGGLAVDPASGELWVGSSQSNTVALVKVSDNSGTVLRQVDLRSQNLNSDLSGLAFDNAGQLLASTTRGFLLRGFVLGGPAVPAPTITAILGTARDGTPASDAAASANVGQAITLVGTGFSTATQVVFSTRDQNGVVGRAVVFPTAVNDDGTRLQVVVPDLAQTGPVTVNAMGTENLGFGGSADAVYRDITRTFTATGSTAQLRFADGGLQALADESWGLDNVRVLDANGVTVYATDFETGAGAEWSSARTDASYPGLFTRFSGRFANAVQVLSLTGLTPGATYTLKFDFYALDSWDGDGQAGVGPDAFTVAADGVPIFHETFANSPGNTQSYHEVEAGSVPLQIVPVITNIAGRPGQDAAVTLYGSGFMEAGSTLIVGGSTLVDAAVNPATLDVVGTRNGQYNGLVTRVVEGPITISTAGGSYTLARPADPAPAFVEFTGIQATAAAGVAANAAAASANTGQSITLVGRGFTGSTLVLFEAVDDRGVVGVLARTGTVVAGSDGTRLQVIVPAQAWTGSVRVVGTAAALRCRWCRRYAPPAGRPAWPGRTWCSRAPGWSRAT